MARPRKITDGIKRRLADFIRSGLTVTDACYGVGISTSTFNRQRQRDPDFDRMINEATPKGWENAKALATYCGYKPYKRKNRINSHIKQNRSLSGLINASGGHFDGKVMYINRDKGDKRTWHGLPILFEYPEKRPTGFFVNGNNGRVERIDGNDALQSMSQETYEDRYLNSEDDIWIGTVY